MKNSYPFLLVLMLIISFSCKKDPIKEPEPEPTPTPVSSNGSIKLEFNPVVETLPLIFGKKYLTPKADTFSVNKFMYYISNIVLERNDNSKFIVPESYYLVNHSVQTSTAITLTNIPAGSYKSISYLIGVDSLHNCSGAQSGALEPSKGMFWSWNSGYIFLKLEGTAPKAPNKSITYHIGGFTGAEKTQRNIFHELSGSPLVIAAAGTSTVFFNVNVSEIFRSPNLIDIATENYVMTPGSMSKKIADNYTDMMGISAIKNNP